jgi:hypothetical protein
MLYFDFLPEELIEILFIHLKSDYTPFIKVSNEYKRIYNKFSMICMHVNLNC